MPMPLCIRAKIARCTFQSVDLGYFVNYAIDESPMRDGVLDLAKTAIQRLGAETRHGH